MITSADRNTHGTIQQTMTNEDIFIEGVRRLAESNSCTIEIDHGTHQIDINGPTDKQTKIAMDLAEHFGVFCE